MVDRVKILESSGLVDGLDYDDKEKIARLCVPKDYEPGGLIIAEDDPARDIYVIYDGYVSLEIKGPSLDQNFNKVQILFYHGIVGEVSFVDGSRRSASVVAMDNVRTLMLPYKEFNDLVTSDYRIGASVMRNLAVLLCSKVRHTSIELTNHMML